ncbi:glycosyl hydrolase-related protein [Bifidobacterium sp. ESL0798]|uniref:alpha-mannosidase n=1 Tax=Bifidobacterium sp. ESL0798 TaxID=2983235 RepID=UPI0023F6AC7B|nr:alpha-mannosidase [Bifidobacterium sp. ESL0798]WEV73846.1 glycosyl hydrolase-related protein [Bifidobacterium sp. ESL0798]
MKIKVDRELAKCGRFLHDRIEPHIERTVVSCDVAMVENPGEPEPAGAFIERAERGQVAFSPARFGEKWGTTWGTTWFRVEGTVPQESLAGGQTLELVVDLGWEPDKVGGQAEGLVYRADGTAIKGLHPLNSWIRLTGSASLPDLINADGSFRLYIEAANNPYLVGWPARSTDLGEGPTGKRDLPYLLKRIDIAVFDEELWNYARDLEVVRGLIKSLDSSTVRYWKAVKALQRSLNAYDDDDIEGTLGAARACLEDVLSSEAPKDVLHENAIGHSHIDSAYMWPKRETHRKVARTVSNALALMDYDPDFRYAMSSAQQYEWLQQEHPDIFKRMLQRVKEGRFIPVGGMWVEADAVMPAGESLVRQITFGRRYFKDVLGVEPRGVWLPDSFGYTGSWPQIARRAGFEWFLTQKISWNDTTKFPHHSFIWQGIDGTGILTHFPPADTYASEMQPEELHYAESNAQDKELIDQSLMLYGYGDGGGGPTREMVGRMHRMRSLEGLATCQSTAPDEFFDKLARQMDDAGAERPHWRGELYLELHRATLTSQQDMKNGCRIEESQLRALEYLSCVAALADQHYKVPREQINGIWKTLLLNQFHDILPGSAISWAHRLAREDYQRDEALLKELTRQACDAIAKAMPGEQVLAQGKISQTDWRGHDLSTGQRGDIPVTCEREHDGYVLDNGILRVSVSPEGTVDSLVDLAESRELVASGEHLAQYALLTDKPSERDAWEIDRDAFLGPVAKGLRDVTIEKQDDNDQAMLRISGNLGRASRVSMTVSLKAGAKKLDFTSEVDWNEKDRFLKVMFPLALVTDNATYECQYGTVQRPVCKNTESDEAHFESCTHRFVYLAESNYGVGVANASTYGASVRELDGDERVCGTQLGMSLLESPTYPDPHTDAGRVHSFAWSVCVGANLPQVVDEASELNAPVLSNLPVVDPLVSLDCERGHIVLDWLKEADDGSGDIVVRLYEAVGGQASAKLRTNVLMAQATVRETDLLEENPVQGSLATALVESRAGAPIPAEGAQLRMGPYQLATLRLHRSGVERV